MNFRLYDILSTLIPGFLIYSALLIFFNVSFETIPDLSALALAFLLGYLNNTISSWLENFLYFTWGGKPSNNLITGKDIWKVRFYESSKVKDLLEKSCSTENPNNDLLFDIALRNVTALSNARVKEFNESYAFSRSIFLCVLIISILINVIYWLNLLYLIFSIVLNIVVWLRSKQRAYYFAREVLSSYLAKENA